MNTVLITGATFGIGYELAKVFAKQKFNLILVARNKERLDQLKEELKEYEVDIYTIVKDLTISNSPQEIFNEIEQNNYEVDILVNNAGFGLLGMFNELELQTQLDMIQLNVSSLVHLTYLFLPQMIKRRNGKILNVASTAAFLPGPYMAIYYSTKAFVLSFTKALSTELKSKGINVTALCPGPTKTEFQKRARMENINLERSRMIPYMSAQKVAIEGYRGLIKGKRVVIPGLINKISVLLIKITPDSLLLSVIKKLNKKD